MSNKTNQAQDNPVVVEDELSEIIKREYLRIRKGEAKVREIPQDAAWERDVVKKLVRENPSVFSELRPDQRTESDAIVFLKDRLKQTDAQNAADKLYYETMDAAPALRLNYESNANEVIEYFDCDLQLPTWLKVKASISMTVSNALSLLKKVNVQLEKFNMKELYEVLRKKLTDILRKEILTYITQNEIGYFHFEISYTEISKAVETALTETCSEFGLDILEFRIEKLMISEKVVDMIQTEYLNTRSLSTRADAEIQWAKSSLEILEKKSEIMNRYGLSQDTLSEMEKDKALDRYLKKVNNQMAQKHELDKPTSTQTAFDNAILQKRPQKPVAPDPIKKVSLLKIILLALGAVAGIAVALLVELIPVKLIGGVVAVVCAAAAIYNAYRKYAQRHEVKEYNAQLKKYEDNLAVYENDLAKYKECKKRLEDEGKAYIETENGIVLCD